MKTNPLQLQEFEIPIFHLSGYVDGEIDETIQKALKKRKLHSPNHLYSVCDGKRSETLKQLGNYREFNPNSIFAFNHHQIGWERGESADPNCLKTHANQYDYPAIAIYNASHSDSRIQKINLPLS